MKDFEKLISECLAEVEALGIYPGKIEKWEINQRAKTRWGQCKKQKDGFFCYTDCSATFGRRTCF